MKPACDNPENMVKSLGFIHRALGAIRGISMKVKENSASCGKKSLGRGVSGGRRPRACPVAEGGDPKKPARAPAGRLHPRVTGGRLRSPQGASEPEDNSRNSAQGNPGSKNGREEKEQKAPVSSGTVPGGPTYTHLASSRDHLSEHLRLRRCHSRCW